MSVLTYVAAGIVIVASVAFVIIGSVYQWDMASSGYALWVRVTGAVAVIALAGVAAWSRIATPLVAVVIMLGGVVLAVAYVLLHRRLTQRVRALLESRDDGR